MEATDTVAGPTGPLDSSANMAVGAHHPGERACVAVGSKQPDSDLDVFGEDGDDGDEDYQADDDEEEEESSASLSSASDDSDFCESRRRKHTRAAAFSSKKARSGSGARPCSAATPAGAGSSAQDGAGDQEAAPAASRPPRAAVSKQASSSDTPRYTGVYNQACGRWRAQFCHGGLVHQLGMYDTEEGAAQAWDRVAWVYRGKAARLNFPDLVVQYDLEASRKAVRDLMDERMNMYKPRGKGASAAAGNTKTSAKASKATGRGGAVRKVPNLYIPGAVPAADRSQTVILAPGAGAAQQEGGLAVADDVQMAVDPQAIALGGDGADKTAAGQLTPEAPREEANHPGGAGPPGDVVEHVMCEGQGDAAVADQRPKRKRKAPSMFDPSAVSTRRGVRGASRDLMDAVGESGQMEAEEKAFHPLSSPAEAALPPRNSSTCDPALTAAKQLESQLPAMQLPAAASANLTCHLAVPTPARLTPAGNIPSGPDSPADAATAPADATTRPPQHLISPESPPAADALTAAHLSAGSMPAVKYADPPCMAGDDLHSMMVWTPPGVPPGLLRLPADCTPRDSSLDSTYTSLPTALKPSSTPQQLLTQLSRQAQHHLAVMGQCSDQPAVPPSPFSLPAALGLPSAPVSTSSNSGGERGVGLVTGAVRATAAEPASKAGGGKSARFKQFKGTAGIGGRAASSPTSPRSKVPVSKVPVSPSAPELGMMRTGSEAAAAALLGSFAATAHQEASQVHGLHQTGRRAPRKQVHSAVQAVHVEQPSSRPAAQPTATAPAPNPFMIPPDTVSTSPASGGRGRGRGKAGTGAGRGGRGRGGKAAGQTQATTAPAPAPAPAQQTAGSMRDDAAMDLFTMMSLYQQHPPAGRPEATPAAHHLSVTSPTGAAGAVTPLQAVPTAGLTYQPWMMPGAPPAACTNTDLHTVLGMSKPTSQLPSVSGSANGLGSRLISASAFDLPLAQSMPQQQTQAALPPHLQPAPHQLTSLPQASSALRVELSCATTPLPTSATQQPASGHHCSKQAVHTPELGAAAAAGPCEGVPLLHSPFQWRNRHSSGSIATGQHLPPWSHVAGTTMGLPVQRMMTTTATKQPAGSINPALDALLAASPAGPQATAPHALAAQQRVVSHGGTAGGQDGVNLDRFLQFLTCAQNAWPAASAAPYAACAEQGGAAASGDRLRAVHGSVYRMGGADLQDVTVLPSHVMQPAPVSGPDGVVTAAAAAVAAAAVVAGAAAMQCQHQQV